MIWKLGGFGGDIFVVIFDGGNVLVVIVIYCCWNVEVKVI